MSEVIQKIPQRAVQASESLPDKGRKDALAEEAFLTKGQLAHEARCLEHARSQAIKTVIHWIVLVLSGLFAVLFATLAFVWVWHLTMPESRRWLGAEDMKQIHTLLFSGFALSFLKDYVSRATKDPEEGVE